jgi:hypothetical protein
MIVQRVPAGEAAVVIRNVDHALTAGQLARAFGKHQFLHTQPVDLMFYVVDNHEEGWRPLDEAPRRNPATGLPYHLGETPPDLLIQKSMASPAWNERRHPWCGLLSSMHSWGLYNGRYGVSDAITIEVRPEDYAEQIEMMLAGELARQGRLKAVLREGRPAGGRFNGRLRRACGADGFLQAPRILRHAGSLVSAQPLGAARTGAVQGARFDWRGSEIAD